MTDQITLEAQPREAGKKETKAVRRAGNVPCVLYGHNVDPVHFQVPVLSLRPLIYTHELHTVNVKVDGQEFDCVLKEVVMHPVTDIPHHADFMVLQAGETLTVRVPFTFHGTPKGQLAGGDTQVVLHDVEVSCLPKDIPQHIDIEIADLEIGDSIHIRDIEIEGIEFQVAPERTIVTIVAPRVEASEDEDELEEELDAGDVPATEQGGEDDEA